MISKQDKVKMFSMRLDGHTLQEIGDEFGVTREFVRQLVGSGISRESCIQRGCKGFIYQNLSRWMIENNISIDDLNIKLGRKQCNSGANQLSKKLHGKASFGLRIDDIKKILEITGMAFEEAFAEKEDNQ